MTVERAVFGFAGFMVLLSVALGTLVHPYWLGLAGFVGLNMLQMTFTRFCPLAIILKKVGLKPGCVFA
mgnify:CR=1 FL=1|jgi:hypothetical protein